EYMKYHSTFILFFETQIFAIYLNFLKIKNTLIHTFFNQLPNFKIINVQSKAAFKHVYLNYYTCKILTPPNLLYKFYYMAKILKTIIEKLKIENPSLFVTRFEINLIFVILSLVKLTTLMNFLRDKQIKIIKMRINLRSRENGIIKL
ncbi:hypothetical protein BpHYR1_030208, partial [Brachionus plicatilis]